jgi:hypothetical protein
MPPSTQELSEFAKTSITAAPKRNTIATAAALIHTAPLPAIRKIRKPWKVYQKRRETTSVMAIEANQAEGVNTARMYQGNYRLRSF